MISEQLGKGVAMTYYRDTLALLIIFVRTFLLYVTKEAHVEAYKTKASDVYRLTYNLQYLAPPAPKLSRPPTRPIDFVMARIPLDKRKDAPSHPGRTLSPRYAACSYWDLN